MKHRLKRLALGFLKVAFAFAALGYVLYKTDFDEIKFYITKSEPVFLLFAFISLNFAVIVGSLRMRLYFEAENMPLPKTYTVIITYIGAFFNTVLPGGIGGDGYITIHIRRKFEYPAMKIIRILLANRANGLFFLDILLFIALYFSDYIKLFPQLSYGIPAIFLLQIIVYTPVAKFVLKERFKTFLKAGLLSFISQSFFVLGAFFVFTALNITGGYFDYLSMFIAAAIAAVLPITPGGVGVRELIFYKGAKLVGLNPQFAVAGSLIYFAIYFSVSLSGLALYLLGHKMHLHDKIHHKENENGADGNPAGTNRLES